MNRRRFIKGASSLFLPAAPAIIRPDRVWAQVGLPGPGPGTAHTTTGGITIPLSSSDSRFSGNTDGGGGLGTNLTTGTTANKFWNNNPSYSSGDQCWIWAISAGTLNVVQCWVDWREGPRIGSDGGTMNVDQCFINCVGKGADHADGAQWYLATGSATVNFTNCCFRTYTDAEAVSIYGAGFIGSDAILYSDLSSGKVTFNNCLFWGGARGVTINADGAGNTTHVSMTNCFFAMSPNKVPYSFAGAGGYGYLINPTAGGTLVIDAWSNNFDATVSGSVITPVNAVPNPTSAGSEWGS